MAVNYGQGYNIYDNIRRKVRAKKSAGYKYGVEYGGDEPVVDYGETVAAPRGVGTATPGMPTATAFSPSQIFGTVDGVPTAMSITESTTGLEFGENTLTPTEFGAQNVTGTFGLSSISAREGVSGTLGSIMENLVSAIDPSPFGIMSGFMGGTLREDPYGRQTAVPGGVLGFVSEMNLEKQYEVAEKIKNGVPGHHQFYMANQLVSIVPQSVLGFDVGFTALGTFQGAPQGVIDAYAGMLGYDPRSVNLMANPKSDPQGFGTKLNGFVNSVGGFASDGTYFTAGGVEQSLSLNQIETHFGLTNAAYGLDYSINALSTSGLSPEVQTSIADGLRSGSIMATPVLGPNGEGLGFETPTGGVVTDADGDPVMSGPPGSQKPVTFGTGLVSYSDVYGYDPRGLDNFEAPSPTDQYSYGSYGGDGGGGDGPSEATQAAESVDQSPDVGIGDMGNVGYAKEGGFITREGMQEGGVPPEQVPQGEAPVAAEAGFVGTEPENVPDVETVADDVPVEVPEGTFVLNAAAVEFMGSADVKKMILEAMQEAEKQGIDITQDNDKIAKEDLVSLVVSKGEVIIPPQLAEIIGYDRLNKINNRGKAEVERRAQEAEQQPQEVQAPQKPAVLREGMLDGGTARERSPRRGKASQEERELERLREIGDDLFGTYKRIAERPEFEPDSPAAKMLDDILKRLRNTEGTDNVVSKTDVASGSTQKQRNLSERIIGLTPEDAQLLYMEMPTIYGIISENKDPEALQAVQRMEQLLKDQVGDNVPEQNAPRKIDDTSVSESIQQMIAELDKPKQRTVSETPVGGEEGFISRSY